MKLSIYLFTLVLAVSGASARANNIICKAGSDTQIEIDFTRNRIMVNKIWRREGGNHKHEDAYYLNMGALYLSGSNNQEYFAHDAYFSIRLHIDQLPDLLSGKVADSSAKATLNKNVYENDNIPYWPEDCSRTVSCELEK